MKISEFAKKYARDNYDAIAAGTPTVISLACVSNAFNQLPFKNKQEKRQLFLGVYNLDSQSRLSLKPEFTNAIMRYFSIIKDKGNSPIQDAPDGSSPLRTYSLYSMPSQDQFVSLDDDYDSNSNYLLIHHIPINENIMPTSHQYEIVKAQTASSEN